MPHKDPEARKEFLRQWRERNAETIKAKQKAYNEANKERRAAVSKMRYQAKRAEIRAKQKAYTDANREALNAKARAYKAANRERLIAEQRAWYHANKTRLSKERLLAGAKYRAQQQGIAFDLTVDAIHWPDTCPVFGTQLTYNGQQGGKDSRASLDKLDCTKGYTVDNVRVISQRANRIKADATIDDLRKIVAYIEQHLSP